MEALQWRHCAVVRLEGIDLSQGARLFLEWIIRSACFIFVLFHCFTSRL